MAFGEDTQRGYDQYAFFGSVDFDILPNLTLTAGTRYYHYNEFETGSQYQTSGGGCYAVKVCTGGGGGDINIDAKNDYNPVDYVGGRVSLKWQVNEDWDILVSEMYQKLDAQGTFNQEPISPDGVALKKLQTVTFEPSYNRDQFWNTAWTVNGQLGDFLHVVYTGGYMVRHIDTQQDYTNYSRAFGEYYQCTGTGTGFGTGAPYCYDPYSYWHDTTRNTHMTHELRLSTPADKRFRVIGGAFYEKFRIYDNMDFSYKSIQVCTANGKADCLGLEQPNPL